MQFWAQCNKVSCYFVHISKEEKVIQSKQDMLDQISAPEMIIEDMQAAETEVLAETNNVQLELEDCLERAQRIEEDLRLSNLEIEGWRK